MERLIIKNANVMDGLCDEPVLEDVAVEGGKIIAVGKLDEMSGREIDAGGQTLAPGFIDVHGHSDMFLFADPVRASKLEQGITTEICGQCGLGPEPVSSETLEIYKAYYKNLGAPIWPGVENFGTMDGFLKAVEGQRSGINLAFFIPHGTVRLAVMGLSHAEPDARQMEKMQVLVREGMESGAMGLSSGLMYAPGAFAGTQELIELTKVVGRHGGFYTSHIRNQADRLLESVAETIEIAEKGGAMANISHHKASGRRNWGKVKESIRLVDEARIPVTHDVYPYAASSTTISGTLPPHYQKMGPDNFLKFIENSENRKELYEAIFNPTEQFDNALGKGGYGSILVLNCSDTHEAEGLSIKSYAEKLGIDGFDAYIKLLKENALAVTYAGFEMSEDDMKTVMVHPKCMFCTDSLFVQGLRMTHPRAIGSFPKILGQYVREEKLLTLGEAIRKMTSYAARVYGFEKKGIIREGYDADLVLFNPRTIRDQADFNHPLLPNIGISKVFVNGELAVENGKATGARAGGILRRN